MIHVYIQVSYKSFAILFGGSCPGDIFNDIWIIDCRDPKYTWVKGELTPLLPNATTATNLPHPRGGHSAVIIGACMYLYGGNTVGTSYDDLWRIDISCLDSRHVALNTLDDYDLQEPLVFPCQEVHATGDAPPAGIGHAAIVLGNNILLYGGRNFFTQQFNPNVYMFDILSLQWRVLVDSVKLGIANRTGHLAFPCNSGIVFFGGATPHEISKSVLHLNLFGTSHSTSSSALSSASVKTLLNSDIDESSFLLGPFEIGPFSVIRDSLSMIRQSVFGVKKDVTTTTDQCEENGIMYSVSFEEIR
jgi:hypothetical protein